MLKTVNAFLGSEYNLLFILMTILDPIIENIADDLFILQLYYTNNFILCFFVIFLLLEFNKNVFLYLITNEF